ncbi:PAS domain-containing protein [Hyphomicrobium sp.]|uniref:PAS domain-containing protein n=1 Tax=Hyphomicrobium sp. TaxID=82 RepID=UPI0025C40FE5|nr:PAS domain-containing protein [Hyphomicrobium sp.]MCC7253124.1 PAS domain-containing protein [Hyphomicrobium sp.]
MRHPATQALYAYWNEIRGERPAPRRLEIQPARIADLLLDTFILERADHSAFRFRLAGTRVAARFGLDLRSQDFLSCWGEGDRALIEHHLAAIADRGRVGVFTGEADLRAEQEKEQLLAQRFLFELVVLPLLHTGHAIDRLLCLMVPLEAADAPANTSIQRLRLLAAEAVWPNGAPEGPAPFSDRQSPLSPHVRTARIVRQGRRQFRVYEGGLERADGDRSDSL